MGCTSVSFGGDKNNMCKFSGQNLQIEVKPLPFPLHPQAVLLKNDKVVNFSSLDSEESKNQHKFQTLHIK